MYRCLIHVAAADPGCAGCNTDLVAAAVIADHGAHGMGAVAVIVAWFGRVGATNATATVNAVVPVVIVIGRSTVPTAILVDQGRMIPIVTGVCHQ